MLFVPLRRCAMPDGQKPDWENLVCQRLSGLALRDREKAEVFSELAQHLEDVYESLRASGLPDEAAFRQTLATTGDWRELRQKIQNARKEATTMSNRVTQLWLPGLFTFAVSMLLLEFAQKIGPAPFVLQLGHGTPILALYVSWLFALPLVGALGFFLSARAKGSSQVATLSGIFPVAPLVAVFLIAIPIGLITGHLSRGTFLHTLVMMTLGWVLAPAAALFFGAMLMRFLLARRSSPQRLAAH